MRQWLLRTLSPVSSAKPWALWRVRPSTALHWTALLFAVCSLFAPPWQQALANGLERLPATTRPIEYRLSLAVDPEQERFTAVANIEFEVLRRTAEVELNLRDLVIFSAALANGAPAEVSYDPARERVKLQFQRPLAQGRQQLVLAYSGAINENVDGVFRVGYPTPAGVKRMAFAHSCCINTARLVVPSWDEPAQKARFVLELTIPAHLDAVANMPVESQTPRADGRKLVRFAATPKMSSYLLFFAVGELERAQRPSGETQVGVITQRGKSGLGEFALRASDDVLRYYNDYFDLIYPLPKLDHVAMPGSGSFGAMENWGAIFYFEPRLLLDPRLATQRDRIGIYSIVAHEVAHQWFGNLVTARWWDDIWLNEAFASWMEIKATARFNPLWNVPLHAFDDKETALRLDAMHGTHPIVGKIETLEQAVIAFDTITYNKGAQLVAMIESWMGEEAFRAAIRKYVRDHAYANSTSSDLWRALDAEAGSTSISAIARDFTEQEGVPLLEVLGTTCDARTNRTTVWLRQGRFSLDVQPVQARKWRVPVQASVVGSDRIVRQIVTGARRARLQLEGCGAVKLNSGENGYFRTLYDAASAARLQEHFLELAPIDRLGLLNDAFGLAQGGYTDFDRYLQLADGLTPQAEPVLLLQFTRAVTELFRVANGTVHREEIGRYVQNKFAPLLTQLEWSPREGEVVDRNILREALIGLLAEVGHGPTLDEARRRFLGSATDPSLLPPSLRKVIVESVGMGADEATFEMLVSRARSAGDSTEQRLYLLALARSAEPSLATRTMELALDGLVPTPLLPTILLAVAERHPSLAYEFVTARFTQLAPRLETTQRTTFVPEIASEAGEVAAIARLNDFAARHIPSNDRQSVKRAAALIAFHDRLRRMGLPQVAAFIQSRGAARSVSIH